MNMDERLNLYSIEHSHDLSRNMDEGSISTLLKKVKTSNNMDEGCMVNLYSIEHSHDLSRNMDEGSISTL